MERKERINWIRDGDHFVGHPVNISGVVIQAESLEELSRKGKMLCRSMLEYNLEIMDQEEPFELKEEPDFNKWLYGEEEAKIRAELARYKEMYGDL